MIKAVLSLVMIFSLFCFDTQAQDFSDLDKSPMDVSIIRNEDNSPMARVIYSRPKMRGREIFGELVPYGDVWRTGANEATEIRLYTRPSNFHKFENASNTNLGCHKNVTNSPKILQWRTHTRKINFNRCESL